MREHFKNIAHVVRTWGKVGEVVVVATDGLPLLVRTGLRVCVVPPELHEPRFMTVVSCRDDGDAQIIRLDGCDTIGEAEKLKGRYLLACEHDLPSDFALMDAKGLIGRVVQDSVLGHLGRIEDFMVGPSQTTWLVSGSYGDVLIPAVPEIVCDIPHDGPISVALPKGLVGEEHDCV